jgi:hypothetical protein
VFYSLEYEEFYGVWAGNVHKRLLKLSIGKVRACSAHGDHNERLFFWDRYMSEKLVQEF